MPYIKDANILFIHIPKTAGTSIEKYFSKKYSIRFDPKSLFGFLAKDVIIPEQFDRTISLQHQTYTTIVKFKKELGIDINDSTKIITIVRNPYTRLVSDLFYNKLIKKETNPIEVYRIILDYITKKYDNHTLQQYKFITDESGALIKNMIILRMETLIDDMKKIGYDDFDIHTNIGIVSSSDYMSYLNANSIKLINIFYDKDFKYFDYPKIATR